MRGRRAGLVALVCVASACSAPPDPAATVAHAYLVSVGRDPMRTLPLLTDAFHRRHGLHVATAGEARGQSRTPGDLAVDRYQLGWLAAQSQPEMARGLGTTLAFGAGELHEEGDFAWIAVPIAPRDGPAFEQRFSLVRAGPDAPWRIDAIEQSGVVPANEAAAFAAYPNEAARRARAVRPGR